MAGLAAGDVLDVKLKWPNDLIVNSAKAGGILVEASGSVVVVGWGVNLWWPGAPAGITALREHDPGPQWGAELARSILESFLQRMTRDPGDWGIEQYRRSCLTLGTRVSWEQDDDDRPNHGVAVGIADDGALLVETTAGPVSLRSGEVRSLRGES
jgi:BirA family biotin operon repressor/biotin-[acetyl-CoA-carboxylase] ligase